MGYLIPRIVEDILAGHLSVDLTARYLNHMTKLMLCWSGQLALVDKAHLCKMTLYVRGAGMTLARIEVDTVALTYTRTYLHPDQLGSATAGTSQSGAVLWREQYAPYGDKLTAPAANDDLGSFTGHIDDDATTDMNLTYMQARYYDPGAGRFTSVDPVTFLDTGEPSQLNRYMYANNDPVNVLDPDGRDGLSFTGYWTMQYGAGDAEQRATTARTLAKADALGQVGGAAGTACVLGGCAAAAPYVSTAYTTSNTTMLGMAGTSAANAGASTSLSGGDAKQVTTSAVGAGVTTAIAVKSGSAFQKVLVFFGGGTLTAGVTDLMDGQKDSSDGAYLATGAITAITGVAPVVPPTVSTFPGAYVDTKVQEGLQSDPEEEQSETGCGDAADSC
jgi:RHS repeat-associated protein